MSSPVKTSHALYESKINSEGQVPIDVSVGGTVAGGSRFVPVDVKNAYVTTSEGTEIPKVVNDGGDHGEFKNLVPNAEENEATTVDQEEETEQDDESEKA